MSYDASIDPFAGIESVAFSEPQVDAVRVAQPTDQPARHRVKLATTVKRGRATFFVWECICGASSPLCESEGRANVTYLEHKSA